MSIYKSIVNNGNMEVEVTLHIGSAQKTGSFGTRKFGLKPGEAKEIEVGDLQHSYLDGISVAAERDGTIIRQELNIQGTDSDYSAQLNTGSGLEIGDLMPPSIKAF